MVSGGSELCVKIIQLDTADIAMVTDIVALTVTVAMETGVTTGAAAVVMETSKANRTASIY